MAQREQAIRRAVPEVRTAVSTRSRSRGVEFHYATKCRRLELNERSRLRDPSRRKLIATLETVRGFDTGLIPKVSYNADRRIGAMGGYKEAVEREVEQLRAAGKVEVLTPL